VAARSGGSTISLAQSLKAASPEWAKEASRPFFRAYGRATSRRRPLPDYLIIGTKRGGSTSMFKYLNRHPNVLPMWPGVENAKKTYFFDRYYDRGTDWYRAHFPTAARRAEVEERTGAPAITGEAAVNYMFNPLVCDRVRQTLPDVKLIVLLRNPVDRIWSHYHERVNAGTEPLSFEDALEAEDERLAGEVERMTADPSYYSERLDFCSYKARGRYLEHLAPWLDAFYPEQLHIVRSEDLYADSGRVVTEVQTFLGLPESPPTPHRYNYMPADTLDPVLREKLSDYYRPHVAALETRLGRSFDWGL
jgi:Sulfotransferase domain